MKIDIPAIGPQSVVNLNHNAAFRQIRRSYVRNDPKSYKCAQVSTTNKCTKCQDIVNCFTIFLYNGLNWYLSIIT